MICDRCKEQGLKSTITERGMAHYLMAWEPYYAEDGNYHSHDVNHNGSAYRCSNGHNFRINNIPMCPTKSCAWNKDVSYEQIFMDDDPPREPVKVYDLGTENSVATTSEIPDIVFDINSFEVWRN